MARKISDAVLIKALLECDTQQNAADRLGITPQTIINRMKNAEFVAKYHEAQNELLRSTTRKLANASGKSADLLIRTMENPEIDIMIRINIAKDILRLQRDFVSVDELQRRISRIEYDCMTKEQTNNGTDEVEPKYKMIGGVN